MGIVVDGRLKLSQGDDNKNLLATYFGNVLSIPFGKEKCKDLKNKPLSWVANCVHNFLKIAMTEEHFLGLIDLVEATRPEPMLAKIYASSEREEAPAIVVSSGKRFAMDRVNFGWNKPVFGSYHFHWGGKVGYVMPMPSPLGNGDWIVYMHLYKRQLDLIESQVADFFRPVTSDYLKI